MNQNREKEDLRTRLEYFDLNPIFVKNVRQAATNWVVIGTLLLLLGLFFCYSYFNALDSRIWFKHHSGGALFRLIGVSMLVTSFIFIPIYFFVRTLMERLSINADLLYITTLTPKEIIWGKMLSSGYMILLFYSTAVPFIAFNYVLGGIDLPSLLLSIFINVTITALLVLAAITLALANIPVYFKVPVLLLGGYLAVYFGVIFVVFLSNSWVINLMDLNFQRGFLPVSAVYLFNVFLLGGALYHYAVAFITPSSANRSRPLRLYLTVLSFIAVVQFYGWALFKQDPKLVMAGFSVNLIVVIAGYFFCTGSQDSPSIRVCRQIPQHTLKRWVAFPFFTGKLSSFVWLSLIWITHLIGFFLYSLLWKSYWGKVPILLKSETLIGMTAVVIYALAYALFSILMHRAWLSRKSPKLACLFWLLITILPMLAYAFLSPYIYPWFEPYTYLIIPGVLLNVPSVYGLLDGPEWTDAMWNHFASSICVLILSIIPNRKWIGQQIERFTPKG